MYSIPGGVHRYICAIWNFLLSTLFKKVWADFFVCDCWRYCKDLCGVKFGQIDGNGKQQMSVAVPSAGAGSYQLGTYFMINLPRFGPAYVLMVLTLFYTLWL